MAYNSANSLSPMIFRKQKKSGHGGTSNERQRSRSVENLIDSDTPNFNILQQDRHLCAPGPAWEEVLHVKRDSPHVTCILPSLVMDFVASALLAVGAIPIIPEDPDDVISSANLDVCKAVIVDASAPKDYINAFMDSFNVGSKPLILIASECGTNDRKRDMAEQIIQRSGPIFITGKIVDIYALSIVVAKDPGSSNSDEEDKSPSVSPAPPKFKVSIDDADSSPVSRRARMRRSTSPAPAVSPSYSPRTSPPDSATCSPHVSPRSSPTLKRRGIQKLINKKKKRANSDGAPLKRVPTTLPRIRMKGQFRDSKHHDIKPEVALDSAQSLSARTNAFIHIFEMSVVTSGEVIVDIRNSQCGIENLPSTLSVCGAVVGAVLSCVSGGNEEDICLNNCVHGLAVYCVAAEESGQSSSLHCEGKMVIPPGTQRVRLLDALHSLDEQSIRSKAQTYAHTEGVKTTSH